MIARFKLIWIIWVAVVGCKILTGLSLVENFSWLVWVAEDVCKILTQIFIGVVMDVFRIYNSWGCDSGKIQKTVLSMW